MLQDRHVVTLECKLEVIDSRSICVLQLSISLHCIPVTKMGHEGSIFLADLHMYACTVLNDGNQIRHDNSHSGGAYV